MATRRSPRWMIRFCNGIQTRDFTSDQMALLLSLAHCTGWSAERISNKFRDATQFVLPPELVWAWHTRWVRSRTTGERVSRWEIDIMKYLLRGAGVEWKGLGRPLSRTVRPTTVEFVKQWSSRPPIKALFDGFTTEARGLSKAYLQDQESKSAIGRLTPFEEPLVAKFGSDVSMMVKDVLKQWSHAVRAKLRTEPDLREIQSCHEVAQRYIQLILDHVRVFERDYEDRFGMMQRWTSVIGDVNNGVTRIRCTGSGVKVFLGIIMADRLLAIDEKRRLERENTAFIEMDISEVPDNSRGCPVCHENLGFENAEGVKEVPLRMIVCCRQIIGDVCLRKWLKVDVEKKSCPTCRGKFSSSFIKKLFSQDDEMNGRDKAVDTVMAPGSAVMSQSMFRSGMEMEILPGQLHGLVGHSDQVHDIVMGTEQGGILEDGDEDDFRAEG